MTREYDVAMPETTAHFSFGAPMNRSSRATHRIRAMCQFVVAGLVAASSVPVLTGCAAQSAVTCTQNAATPTGITIARGHVIGTMTLACSGVPDSYDFRIILVKDGQMLKPGTNIDIPPGPEGTEASTFAPCTPGAWHVYFLVTWTYQGQVAHNTTTTLADKVVVLDDC